MEATTKIADDRRGRVCRDLGPGSLCLECRNADPGQSAHGTSGEVGGALGIALLGSLGTALYRGFLRPDLTLTAGEREQALDTLGGAVEVAAVVALAIALLAWRMLASVAPLASRE